MDSKGQWCFIAGFLVLICPVRGVISQPLLSINRYFAMFHPEKSKRFFKNPYYICILIVLCHLMNTADLKCASNISKLICKHTEAKNDHKWCIKIREAKFIIRFIYIEVFMPICIETPVFILIFVNRYLSPIPREVMAFMLGCFIIHGTSDPIVISIVIKLYRRLIEGWFKKVWSSIDATNYPTTIVGWINGANTTILKLPVQ
uniref:Uncharacterized protein n=1 Tax=Romanomermis culicivorax TaxID=13658 RepID=A0A915KAC9_ROMCU